jgi:hypothetical protein
MTSGYGMSILAFQVVVMTLMFYRDNLFSQLMNEASHLLFSSQSTHGHMTWGTTLWIVYIPEWSDFMKIVPHPIDRKKQYFAKVQESARKDIERAFGVLQTRWGVIHGPTYGWDRQHLSYIMSACIIMHNMIVEAKRGGHMVTNTNFDNIDTQIKPVLARLNVIEREAFVNAHHKIHNRDLHYQLQSDLIEYNWMRHGLE